MEKIFRIFQTYQQTFQKTEILSFFISKKKPLTNVKKWTRKIEIKFGNIKLKFKKKKKKKKQRVIFSYNMREQKSIIFPFSFFFIFHPKLLNQWKSERCSWKAISDNAFIGYQSNVSYNHAYEKSFFSVYLFFFVFSFHFDGEEDWPMRWLALYRSKSSSFPFFTSFLCTRMPQIYRERNPISNRFWVRQNARQKK